MKIPISRTERAFLNSLSEVEAAQALSYFPESHPNQVQRPTTPEIRENRHQVLQAMFRFFELERQGKKFKPIIPKGYTVRDPLDAFITSFLQEQATLKKMGRK